MLRAAFLSLVAVLVVTSTAAGAPSQVAVSQAVRDEVQHHGWARVIVEVRPASGAHLPEGLLRSPAAVANQRIEIQSAQARMEAQLAGSDHRVVHRFRTVPFVALEVGATGLAALQQWTSDVIRVVPDKISYPHLLDSGPLVQADRAWARGFDGTGTVIAIIDTGVQPSHVFLRDKVVDQACFSSGTYVLCPSGREREEGPGTGVMCPLIDQCEHATHVAGIAAGSGTSGGVWFSGVARGAQLASYAVFSGFDCSPFSPPCIGALDSDIMAALERIYAQRTTFNFAAVNMSLGAGLSTSTCDDEVFKPIIDNLRSVGIPTVVSAGNDGARDAMSSPACISSAISVGATLKDDTGVASFTNAAPFMTVFAPGAGITSSMPLGFYQAGSGTSMSAPHVAGMLAVLRQAVPGASVSELVAALETTGVPVVDTRTGGTVTRPSPRLESALDRLLGTGSGPSATSLTPATAAAGSGGFTLTVDGANFGGGTTVLWNGAPRPTTFVSPSRLTASIPAGDVEAAALASVRVRYPEGRVSNALTFTATSSTSCPSRQYYVEYFGNTTFTGPAARTECAPAATDVWPPRVNHSYGLGGPPGLPADNFSVRWTGRFPFAAGDYTFRLISWNDAVRLTIDGVVVADRGTPGGRVHVTRTMTAGDHEVKIEYVDLTGDAFIHVDWRAMGSGEPTIADVSPEQVWSGDPGFTLTVTGQFFDAGTTVFWNGEAQPTTFVDASRVTAAIPADLIAVGDFGSVSVRTGDIQNSNADFVQVFQSPVITALTPESVVAGSPGFTLFVEGPGVQSGSVHWNGSPRPTTAVGRDALAAEISAADVATAGTATVTLVSGDGRTSNAASFRITTPADTCPAGQFFAQYFGNVALTPPATRTACEETINNTYGAGGPVGLPVDHFSVRWTGRFPFPGGSVTFTARADDGIRVFLDGVAVIDQWRDQPATAYTATRSVSAGQHEIRVEYYERGGGAVVQVSWTGGSLPAPQLGLLTPTTATAGGPAFVLTANGANFVSGATLLWNGAARPTTFVSATRLTASIPASDIAAAGTAELAVRNPDSQLSNAVTYSITAAGGCPSGQFRAEYFTNVNLAAPATRTQCEIAQAIDNEYGAGGPPGLPVDNFSVRWTGTFHFQGGDETFSARADDGIRVFLDGVPIIDQWRDQPATTYTVRRVVTEGPHEVRVEYYERGGDAVVQVSWTSIGGPSAPTLTALRPASAAAGGSAFTLNVDGSDLRPGATVLWHGTPRPTTVLNAAWVQASIASTDLATAGSVPVTLRNPDGSVSNALTFTITGGSPPPSLATITPASAAAGGAGFTLTADGANFVSGATVLWNGAARTTTFVSATRLTAVIPAADIAAAGSASVTVRNPDGQASSAQTFTITAAGGCATGQFRAEYFASIALTPPAARTACESTVSYDYGAGGPAGLPVDNFSVRWTGRFTFTAGTVIFTARADDGIRVFLDGVAIIDQWRDQPATTYTATRTVTAGEHEVKVEYYERGGAAVAQVSWAGGGPAPAPTLTALSPNSVTAGAAAFTLVVDGTNLTSGAAVLWNGAVRSTTFVSATRVTASIPASDVAAAGSASVAVRNPDGQTSNALTFTVTPTGGGTIKVIITAPASGATVRGTGWFTVWIEGAAAGSRTVALSVEGRSITSTTATSNGPISLAWPTTAADNGSRTATVTVGDSTGNTGSASVTVTVAN